LLKVTPAARRHHRFIRVLFYSGAPAVTALSLHHLVAGVIPRLRLPFRELDVAKDVPEVATA
jgi:hypothetical protein